MTHCVTLEEDIKHKYTICFYDIRNTSPLWSYPIDLVGEDFVAICKDEFYF